MKFTQIGEMSSAQWTFVIYTDGNDYFGLQYDRSHCYFDRFGPEADLPDMGHYWSLLRDVISEYEEWGMIELHRAQISDLDMNRVRAHPESYFVRGRL